jgi:ribosome-associated toxin RatA of RatAB toxin-antitoxin module
MFDLVNDINAYPEFIPNCIGAVVKKKCDNSVEAELTLAKAGMIYRFSTQNTLQRPHKMELKLLSGPFKQFDGIWTFKPMANNGCEVSFELTFEFSNMLLNMTAGKWMEDLAGQQVNTICQRARAIYG